MQSVHGTGEPGLDAIKVTNWNLANKVVTLAYFQGKMNFFGNCFPKKQSDNKRVTSNPKRPQKNQANLSLTSPSPELDNVSIFSPSLFTLRSFRASSPMSSS